MTPTFSDLVEQATKVLQRCEAAGLKVATAESCTGGLIAVCLTEVPHSSKVVDRGFVTYSNQAKTDMLGVPAQMIAEHGAVSEPVARAMAAGALARSAADLAVSVTGIAGPGGGSTQKPVGLVHLAAARKKDGKVEHVRCTFGDIGRQAIRFRSVQQAYEMLDSLI